MDLLAWRTKETPPTRLEKTLRKRFEREGCETKEQKIIVLLDYYHEQALNQMSKYINNMTNLQRDELNRKLPEDELVTMRQRYISFFFGAASSKKNSIDSGGIPPMEDYYDAEMSDIYAIANQIWELHNGPDKITNAWLRHPDGDIKKVSIANACQVACLYIGNNWGIASDAHEYKGEPQNVIATKNTEEPKRYFRAEKADLLPDNKHDSSVGPHAHIQRTVTRINGKRIRLNVHVALAELNVNINGVKLTI